MKKEIKFANYDHAAYSEAAKKLVEALSKPQKVFFPKKVEKPEN